MKIQEAYQLLEVDENISDEDLKRKYKEAAKKYHPDICDDKEKFKSINEAHQLIKDHRENPHKYAPQQDFFSGFNITDFFGGGNRHQKPPISASHIQIHLSLSFHEAIKGVEKEITYHRNSKCEPCDGNGSKHLSNGCPECDGFGRTAQRRANFIIQGACSKCQGKNVKEENCIACQGKRVKSEERKGNVQIPPGAKNNDILRMQGEGHYVGKVFMGQDGATDVHLILQVSPFKDFSLQENDVHSSLDISLLQALTGFETEVETVYQTQSVSIPAQSKHLDQIKIPHQGVGGQGFHIVNLRLQYPDNLDALINHLQKESHVSDPVQQ